METKPFRGKALYQPAGKAGEYARWACNFYTGCSNGCDYCYCRKGVLGNLWSLEPKLKGCFKNEDDALGIFEKEVVMHKEELQKFGVFFSFTTDPMLPLTCFLTINAIEICIRHNVPTKILTKEAWWTSDFNLFYEWQDWLAVGFTLTGHDELETRACKNRQRIEGLHIMQEMGFKTFVSLEPIIDFESSMKMIEAAKGCCNLFLIGLESGRKYPLDELVQFFFDVTTQVKVPVYWKDSFLSQAGIKREIIGQHPYIVGRDWDIFQRGEQNGEQ